MEPSPPRLKGYVHSVHLDKGFAFIRGEDQIMRFAHAKNFEPRLAFDLLRKNDRVTFVSADYRGDPHKGGNQQRAIEIHVEREEAGEPSS